MSKHATMKTTTFILTHWPRPRPWQTVSAILSALNRRAELERLVTWADRKNVPGPRRFYAARLTDQEVALTRYTLRYPRLVSVAHVLHWLNQLLSPSPRSFARGSAAVYRSRRRVLRKKSLIKVLQRRRRMLRVKAMIGSARND